MILMRNTMTSTCKPVIWGALCGDSCIKSASSKTVSSSLGVWYIDVWPTLHQENWWQDNYFLQALPSLATLINMIYCTLFHSRLLVYIEHKSIRSVMFNNWGSQFFNVCHPEVFNTYINIQWCISQTQQNFIMFIIVLHHLIFIQGYSKWLWGF